MPPHRHHAAATCGLCVADVGTQLEVTSAAGQRSSNTMRAAANKIQQRVVVVGGGLAGQSAAIQAARLGAKVLLLEKEGRLGGNSAKATSGINGWGTEAQRLAGVEDDAQHFERDTFLSGRGGNCDAGLVRMLSMKSAEAVQWLSDLGVPLTVLSQLGGASRKRCHRAPDKADGTPQPIGFIMVKTLEDHLRTQLQEHVTIETNARLLRLHKVVEVQASGQHLTRVSGVTYIKEGGEEGPATMDVEADAVILATGGFSNDHTATSLLEEYAPHLSSFPTTNGPWATGDGVKIARELGVHLVDMDKVQLHPTGLLNPQNPLSKTVFLGPEALRGSGGILLNKNGERFINELDLRSVVSQAIIAQDNEYPNSTGRKFAHCVLNDQAADLFGRGALGFYWKKLGLFQSAESVEELAQLIGCDEATLRQTLVEYEKLSSTKSSTCPTTGKNVFPCVVGPQGPFYVAYVTPSIHYTMGGCLISPSAEIQSAVDQPLTGRRPILGLFGAGEVTGGVHGGNRLGGNSLLECVVFGKIAGGRAAHGTSIGEAALPDDEEAIALTVQEVLPEGPPETSRSFNGSQLVLALPSSFQTSGLRLLEQVTIRAGGHSSVVMPSSPPSQLGSLSIYLPPLTDLPEGSTDGWLYDLHAGAEVTVSRVRSSHGDASMRLTQALSESKHMYLIAHAPDGVASMLQLLRAALEEPLRSQLTRLHLIYAATDPQQLTYQRVVEHCGEGQVDGFFRCTLALSNPSLKWEHEIGITPETIRRALGSHRGSSEEATIVVASSAERKEEIIFALSENGLMTKNVIFVEA